MDLPALLVTVAGVALVAAVNAWFLGPRGRDRPGRAHGGGAQGGRGQVVPARERLTTDGRAADDPKGHGSLTGTGHPRVP